MNWKFTRFILNRKDIFKIDIFRCCTPTPPVCNISSVRMMVNMKGPCIPSNYWDPYLGPYWDLYWELYWGPSWGRGILHHRQAAHHDILESRYWGRYCSRLHKQVHINTQDIQRSTGSALIPSLSQLEQTGSSLRGREPAALWGPSWTTLMLSCFFLLLYALFGLDW